MSRAFSLFRPFTLACFWMYMYTMKYPMWIKQTSGEKLGGTRRLSAGFFFICYAYQHRLEKFMKEFSESTVL